MEHLSKEISENQRIVEERLQGCDDILLRPIMLGKDRETACFLIYIETAVSNLMLEDSVIGRFLNGLRSMEQAELYETLEKDGMGLSDTGKLWDMEAAFAAMLAGNAVLFADGLDFALKIGSKGYPGNGVQKAESEKVLRGSREAFSESEKTNTALIRKRIRNTGLKVKETPLGESSHTMAALLYMEDLILYSTDLILPHPYVAERAFVLESLNEIAPYFVDPVQRKQIRQLWEAVKETKGS